MELRFLASIGFEASLKFSFLFVPLNLISLSLCVSYYAFYLRTFFPSIHYMQSRCPTRLISLGVSFLLDFLLFSGI